MYAKIVSHTTDPVMEAYGRISQIRLVSGDDVEKRIKMNLDALMDMLKKPNTKSTGISFTMQQPNWN